MTGRTFRAVSWLLLIAVAAGAAVGWAKEGPLPKESVPDPLRPWVPWVLHGTEDRQCPFFYNNGEQRQCSWPSRLTLTVTGKGAGFSLQVAAFRSLWMPLPGDRKHWPQDVKVDGKPVPVVAQGDRPGAYLTSGAHTIAGSVPWSEVPESLQLPSNVGLVALTSNGSRVAVPNLDSSGRLWLKQQSDRNAGAERLEVRVSRLVSDDIPLVVSTHLDLTASGKSQEVVVPNALLEGFTPLSLSSSLPARFEVDGALRVQVRPGRWQIVATGRNMAPQASLALPRRKDKLAPAEEVWAFEPHPELRLVTIEGVPAVDPQQTTLPQDWRRYPAYLLKPGDAMRLHQTKRGDPEAEPDRLSLARRIWLDFDGGGYTVQDRIGGSIARSWRLEMANPQLLGRVAVDGVDQYITRLDERPAPGVELRRGAANIQAESRIDAAARSLSATGWLQDFDHLSTTLYLPPGWRLLHASGVDRVAGAWVERWTLLDFLVVLILGLAAGKLFGWRWGAVALVAVAWVYHERGAPIWYWLNVLAAVALLTVLREGRLRKSVTVYRWLSLAALALVLVPFAVQQVRQALYPVLERPWATVGQPQVAYYTEPQSEADNESQKDGRVARRPAAPPPAKQLAGALQPRNAPAPAVEATPAEEAERANKLEQQSSELRDRLERKKADVRGTAYGSYRSDSGSAAQVLSQIDPNAKVQTGPGLPQWSWNDYELQWSGPVEHTQTMRLWLLSPLAAKLMTFATLGLLFALFARIAIVGPMRLPRLGKTLGNIAAALVLASICGLHTDPAQAQSMPSPELLDQLRGKLLSPPECLPQCAEISRLKLTVAADLLQLRLEAHAQTDTAIPLPGGAQQWLPDQVTVDGSPARGLMRDAAGNLWVELAKGVHQIAMQSGVSARHSAQIALPLKPHRVEASLSGWTLDGLGEEGEAGESLLLTRIAGNGRSAPISAGDSLPPFVRVERTLNLGLIWQGYTRVVRAGPSTAPVLVKIPLLEGESVTNSEVRVQNGAALVNLGPQTGAFVFESAIKQSPRLTLTAPGESNQIEVWRLNLGTQWHVQLSGIPVIHQQDGGLWLPEWRPWPGEQVTLSLARPAGVTGQTLTLDRSMLLLSPGIRATDAELQLTMRSSRGGRHSVRLPEGAVLQSVRIDGQTQPIRLEGGAVDLPVHPGAQTVHIAWREPRGISMRFVASPIDAGTPGVNGALEIRLPEDRWLLFVGGPPIGPAVLFWGVVIVLAVIAFALGKVHLTPLKAYQWFLLLLGLTQAPLLAAAMVIGWLLALGARRQFGDAYASNRWFNLGQVTLALLTLAALASLFWAVENGLLGYPAMQIAGNGSTPWALHWYQDRMQASLPTAWVVSVPMMVYRLLMLAWALWLAYSLLKWLRWAWECYSDHGYWRKLELWRRRATAVEPKGERSGEGAA